MSVIVPVYGVAAYLPACLDSLLAGDADIEVIAVDDASTDGSAAILDLRSAADPRLQAIHLDRNGGQGAARNLALAGPAATTSGSSTATTRSRPGHWPPSARRSGRPSRTCC